jgi:hypothetical protein
MPLNGVSLCSNDWYSSKRSRDPGRVEGWRGCIRRRGVAVTDGFRSVSVVPSENPYQCVVVEV